MHRKLKRYERALELYKSYLRNLPDAPNRAVVEELMTELEGLIAAQRVSDGQPLEGVAPTSAPATSPTTPTPPREGRTRWYSDTWGWILVGSGVAAGGVGLGFLLSSNHLEDDLQTATESDRPGLRSSIDGRRTIATIGFVAGGALVAGGIVKFALHPSKKNADYATRASIRPGWIVLQGRF